MKKSHFLLYIELFSIILSLTSSVIAQNNFDPQRFSKEINDFNGWDKKNSYPENAILFVGSSSIRMWMTHDSFPEMKVINRGFGGAHISDVNFFIKEVVFKYRPRLIFFYAGDNDIAEGKSVSETVADFKKFMQMTLTILPKTKIVYLPIKPSLSRWGFWNQMNKVNFTIEELAKENNSLFYLDTATPMLNENGTPKADIFREDGLHMNLKGYRIWNKFVEKFLETEKDK